MKEESSVVSGWWKENGTILKYIWRRQWQPTPVLLAWKTPWMEEPGRLQSMGSWRVWRDWATSLSLFTLAHLRRKWQPTPVFLPGESQGRRSLVGFHLWDRTESDTTEATWQQQQQLFILEMFSWIVSLNIDLFHFTSFADSNYAYGIFPFPIFYYLHFLILFNYFNCVLLIFVISLIYVHYLFSPVFTHS